MNRYQIVALLAAFFLGTASFAQRIIAVETAGTSLIFSVGQDGKLLQSYFGDRLKDTSMWQLLQGKGVESYVYSGTDNLFEPAMRLVHGDENPSLDLKYDSYKREQRDADVQVTSIVLKDPVYPVTVTLEVTAYYKENTFSTRMRVVHQEKKPVVLTNFASSMLHFNAAHYFLTQFHGDWAKEMRMEESELTSGIKVIDSKLGTRAHMYQAPAFFLSLNKSADEEDGELVAGTLAWSGNFQFEFEVDEKEHLRVISGMNPFASAYTLEAGKVFETPAFIFTYSHHGKGEASRNLHYWARNYGVLNGNGPRLTLLNNWEATQFGFDEQKLSGLFTEAKTLGVDMFLLDDGWFGNKYPRNDDHAGLGDWQENKAKLPNGIGHLVKDAASKGVKFGIWLEPEMVNPRSELYEKHPDWILKLPNRPEHYYRNQLVLDLTNPAVQQFVYDLVDGMLRKNDGVAYIKWDCNRMMTNTYSPYLRDKQSHIYIEYVRSLYKILERIRQKYPALPMMLCSGGGGRADYGALKYFTEFWPSDNTDAAERVFIQWGYSNFFPAVVLSNHITSWGKESLKYRTDVAMSGRLGYDIDVSKMSKDELQFSQEAVKTYKRLSPVIWKGDLFRLVSPYEAERSVELFVDSMQSHAVLFAYNLHVRYGQLWTDVRLKGLDAQKHYRVKELNLYPGIWPVLGDSNDKVYTGDYLMKEGLNVSNSEALTSAVIELTAE